MSIDEFHVMEPRLGWKHEYWDGAARLSPQSTAVVDFERPIEERDLLRPRLAAGYELRAIRCEDEQALVGLFIEAFDRSVEYAGWDDEQYHRDAEDCIQSFFGTATRERFRGRRDGVAEHSLAITSADRIVAAILIRRLRRGPIVEPIMVAEGHQRRGIGHALLQGTLLALQNAGNNKLYSRCHLGNTASLCWHEQSGFREMPNYFVATHRQRHFASLVRHHQHAGAAERATESRRMAEHWDAVVRSLDVCETRWSSDLLE